IREKPTVAPTKVEVELALEAPDLGLKGRVDRVEITNKSVHIVDLKSSWAYGDEIHEGHRQQLLLYAALWQRTHGEWPRTASVQMVDGARISFQIDPVEVQAVVARARAALDGFNGLVSQGCSPMDLATPSADACRGCDYRVVCGPFFGALEPA